MAGNALKLLAVCVLVLPLFGCDRPSSPPAATDTKPTRRQFAGIDFVPPSDWTAEEEIGGLLLTAPEIENDWQANVFLELRRDTEGRSLEQVLDDLVPNLKSRKEQFQEVGREIRSHPSGLRCATLEYTCAAQGTPLTEWEIIVELDGEKRLFLLTSAASSSWTKYRPVFQTLVDSLRASRP